MLIVKTGSGCKYPYFNETFTMINKTEGTLDESKSCQVTYGQYLGNSFHYINFFWAAIFFVYFIYCTYRLVYIYFLYFPIKRTFPSWRLCWKSNASSNSTVLSEQSRLQSAHEKNSKNVYNQSGKNITAKNVMIAPALKISILGWIISLLFAIDYLDVYGTQGLLPIEYGIIETRICNFFLIYIVIQIADFILKVANLASKTGLPLSEWILLVSLAFFTQIIVTALSFSPGLFVVFDFVRKILLAILDVFIWARLYLKVRELVKFLNSMKDNTSTAEGENKAVTTLRTKFNRLQLALLGACVFNIVTVATSASTVVSSKGDYSYSIPPPNLSYFLMLSIFQALYQIFALQVVLLMFSLPKRDQASPTSSEKANSSKNNDPNGVVVVTPQ